MRELSLSDEQLVQLYTLGNPKAMNVLYNRHQKKVLLYLYFKLKDKSLAEDIFQDSFIKLLKYIDDNKYIDNGKFYNLLIKIARNAAIDYIRAKSVRPITLEYQLYKHDKEVVFIENIEKTELKKQLYIDEIVSLVDLLNTDEREIIILKHYADMTFKEIALMMDMNLNTALSKMRVALKKLKYLAEQRGLHIPNG